MQFGLTESQITNLQNIFAKYPEVNQVIVYGSRAKGNFSERSDIDLIIKDSKISRTIINKIMLDFEESNIPFIVELQNYDNLKNLELIDHINRVGKIIYERVNFK
jgi:predicted nucleotidyltransferase